MIDAELADLPRQPEPVRVTSLRDEAQTWAHGPQRRKHRVMSWVCGYARRYSVLAQVLEDGLLIEAEIPARLGMVKVPEGTVWLHADKVETVSCEGQEGRAKLFELWCEFRWAQYLEGGQAFGLPCAEAGAPFDRPMPEWLADEFRNVVEGRSFRAGP